MGALIELMTATNTLRLLQDANFSDWSFGSHEVEALDQFVREWAGAEREFIDQDLEGLRKDLAAAGDAFISSFPRNTRHAPWSFGYRIVPQDWEKQEPEGYQVTQ